MNVMDLSVSSEQARLSKVKPESVLSKRQRDVTALVAQGLRNKEIAAKLFIGEKTVKFHLTNIFKILKINSRVKLSIWARGW